MSFNNGFNTLLKMISSHTVIKKMRQKHFILSSKELVRLVAQIDMLIFSNVLKIVTYHILVCLMCLSQF